MAALSKQNVRLNGVDAPNGTGRGFTLLELLVALSILAILVAVTTPLFASYYGDCCLKAVMWEIEGMVREAKQNALSEKYYAICFDPVQGRIVLSSGRGPDGQWNTADDEIVRSLRFSNKGGGLVFGYGSYGPVPTYASDPDGITFQDNTLVCNPDLTGNSGSVYIRSRHGGAMALTMNSTDFGYKVRRCSGSGWEAM